MLRLQPIGADMVLHDHAMEDCLFRHGVPYSIRTMVRSQAMQFTIGKLAAAGGVGVETIRYYQRRGLLGTPVRSGGDGWGGGIRRYGDKDLRRLKFIRAAQAAGRSEEHTSELQSLMRISYAVFCLKKNNNYNKHN